MRTRLLGLMLVLAAALLGCTNEDYEQAMTDGQAALEDADYAAAATAFEQALEEDANDETAEVLLEQTQTIQNASDALSAGNLDQARDSIEQVMDTENGSDVLADQASDMQETIETLKAKHEEYAAVYDEVENAYAEESFDQSIELIDNTLENDMSHAAFADLQDDFETLRKDVKEDKQAAELAAEKAAEAKEKEKTTEAAADEQESGVDALVGYWLNTEENIAAHITETYIATAMPESDFITNDEVSDIEPISETKFNITYADGKQGKFKLTNNKETLITPGLDFKRVSKAEANAIFDGQYELP